MTNEAKRKFKEFLFDVFYITCMSEWFPPMKQISEYVIRPMTTEEAKKSLDEAMARIYNRIYKNDD